MSGEGSAALLAVAEDLLNARPVGPAHRNRAISTAYYATFHALAEVCADTLLPGVPVLDDVCIRTYRALDHGPLRQAFGQAPLRDAADFRAIADGVIELQSARHAADYRLPHATLFSEGGARLLLGSARQTVERIAALALAERRVLATCLLFRTR